MYFGRDKEAALKRWADEKDYLLAGRPVPRQDGKPTLVELANLYAAGCTKRVYAGELSQQTLDEYTKSIKRLIEIRGKGEKPDYWSPLDYAAIKDALFAPIKRTVAIRGGIKGSQVERRSSVTVDGDIRVIKAFLNWAADCELINPPRFGKEFSQTSRKTLRKLRSETGRRDIPADSLRTIIGKASPHFKPIVLLAINGGIGAKDIAHMRLDQYARGNEWLNLPRLKTGTDRRIWLWPETSAAIDAYLKRRMTPYGKEYADRLFVTKYRQPWVRGTHDGIGKLFAILREECKIDRGTFYDLRRTFQTIGDETKDYPTVKFVMGHVADSNDMSANYRQHIPDESIRAVCEYVRKWLFG